MLRSRCAITTVVLFAGISVPPALSQSEGRRIQGEQLEAWAISEGFVETLEDIVARDQAAPSVTNSKARGDNQGIWSTPTAGSTYYPASGDRYIVNKWGDTQMGIGFVTETDVHGAYFSGQGGEGVWTPAVRAIGYRLGNEVDRTDWFDQIGNEPAWFEMDLRGVDRIVIESESRMNGGGWYALDDLTFTRKAGAGQNQPATIVLNFEDLGYKANLTDSGYGGLVWETGTGDFNSESQIIPPPRERDYGAAVPPAEMPSGTARGGLATAPELILDFQGSKRGDLGQFSGPPDTCGAIGPNHYVEMVNTIFSVYNKTTGALITSSTLFSFFSGGSGDPRIIYDQHSDRWIALDSNFSNRVYFAVSTSNDPTGSWFKFNVLVSTSTDTGCFPDYPTLGADANGIYVGNFMVGCGRTILALDKAPLVTGSPSVGTVTAFRNLGGGTQQPAQTYGNPVGNYFVSDATFTDILVRRIDPPLSAPTLVEMGTVTIPAVGFPPDVPAFGTATNLDSLDLRYMNAVYRDGSIWTAHTVAGSGVAAACRWYEIDVATMTLVQSGEVTDPGINYWIPSIGVNARGDVIMGFSGSNSSIYPACYYTGRRFDDPLGQMAPPVEYQTGLGFQNLIDSFGRNRWGDYSLCTLDPDDELTMWTVQEYGHSPSGATSIWGTRIAQLRYFVDCNGNAVDDYLDIQAGTSPDGDTDFIPDECQATRLHVDPTAAGIDSGLNWTDAYTSLAEALKTAETAGVANEIWVAAGTYTAASPGGDRTKSFVLSSGVQLLGGFAGGEASANLANPTANLTVLSGDLNGDDGTTGTAENTHRMLVIDNGDASTLVNGFTIRAGLADGALPSNGGAGVFVDGGNPSITNCIIEDNSGSLGGGIYANQASPTVSNCTLQNNSADTNGGAVYSLLQSPVLTDCNILDNTAGTSGGALYTIGSTADVSLINCLAAGNSSVGDGGAIFDFFSGTTSMINCTIADNTAGGSGGGVLSNGSIASFMVNSVIWGNSDSGGSGEAAQINIAGGSFSVDYSTVQGLTGGLGGVGNIGGNPMFAAFGDYQLSNGSSAIDAGDNTAVPGGVTTDLNGNPRFTDDPATADTGNGVAPIVDMGAYEGPVAGTSETIVSAVSLNNHGGAELAIEMNSSNVEPRNLGLRKLEFTVSGPVNSVSSAVSCAVGSFGGTITTSAVGSLVTVEFSTALPDQDCCTISLTGQVDDSFAVRPLKGDVDRNGVVSTGDASVIKPRFGQDPGVVGAEFDFDANGIISTGDASLIKPIFGNASPACP